MEVKLVIDGKEIPLIPNGESKNYQKFCEPDMELGPEGEKPLIVSVHRHKNTDLALKVK